MRFGVEPTGSPTGSATAGLRVQMKVSGPDLSHQMTEWPAITEWPPITEWLPGHPEIPSVHHRAALRRFNPRRNPISAVTTGPNSILPQIGQPTKIGFLCAQVLRFSARMQTGDSPWLPKFGTLEAPRFWGTVRSNRLLERVRLIGLRRRYWPTRSDSRKSSARWFFHTAASVCVP